MLAGPRPVVSSTRTLSPALTPAYLECEGTHVSRSQSISDASSRLCNGGDTYTNALLVTLEDAVTLDVATVVTAMVTAVDALVVRWWLVNTTPPV